MQGCCFYRLAHNLLLGTLCVIFYLHIQEGTVCIKVAKCAWVFVFHLFLLEGYDFINQCLH